MFRRASALTLLFSLVVAISAHDALAAGRLAAYRAARTAALQAPAAAPAPEMVQPGPAVVGSAMYAPQPSLIYRNRVHHAYGCAPPVEMVLTAINPCTCCPVAIPVCVPACCQGKPAMSCRGAVLWAGVVDFDWACGYRVTARFRYDGQVVVVTRG